ncbi:MAG: multicopper oxidase domain-containing protein [Flavobacteriales bacterium]|nr:multicopper oxidase domain-containing protein [Flavobacteriales bacterium]
MRIRDLLLPLLLAPCPGLGAGPEPAGHPPGLDLDTFESLVVDEHHPSVLSGREHGDLWGERGVPGPTLIMHRGDTARVRVQNELAQITNMHWHGLQVPGEFDGGPPREIAPGDS